MPHLFRLSALSVLQKDDSARSLESCVHPCDLVDDANVFGAQTVRDGAYNIGATSSRCRPSGVINLEETKDIHHGGAEALRNCGSAVSANDFRKATESALGIRNICSRWALSSPRLRVSAGSSFLSYEG